MNGFQLAGGPPRMRAVQVGCAALVALGAMGVWTGVRGADGARTFGALIASWLFFTGLSVGALAFAALLELSGARWAEALIEISRRLTRFIPVSAVLLLFIFLGLSVWAPWYHRIPAQQGFWFDTPLFATRELLGSAALFGFALLFMRPGPARLPGWVSVTWLLLYAAVVSMWAFDFVLGTDLTWSSTLIGPHLFAGAFISGAALSIALALVHRRLDRQQRHDAGALTVALGIFWGYLFWSQFLTLWYGNLPDEVEYLLRRASGGWQLEALAVVLCVVALPLLLLLSGRGKESPRTLGLAVLLQLGGLWMERHLLIVPSLSGSRATPFDLHGALVALGLLGLFVLVNWDLFRGRAAPEAAEANASPVTTRPSLGADARVARAAPEGSTRP